MEVFATLLNLNLVNFAEGEGAKSFNVTFNDFPYISPQRQKKDLKETVKICNHFVRFRS